jgi:hypothetical protein
MAKIVRFQKLGEPEVLQILFFPHTANSHLDLFLYDLSIL